MRSSAARLSPLLALLLLAAPALTACQTDSAAAPEAQAPAAPLTHQEAALQCWMSTEKPDKTMPLDKRADIVTKCINAKMHPGQTPAAAAPKLPPKPPKEKT